MTRIAIASGAALAALPAAAHEAGGVVHIHPHGTEALLALATVFAAFLLWRSSRNKR
ncbi:hypothetical protein N8I71_04205 [Roseibacterium sp. SDUM158016]|uniref:hypothetical protein n=1 Tax=Roseicyclus sediminis TaxID=2980997 RepID=UPI0021CF97CA|nr:hypothetical protein [Roseibacterium sp. SDUM158016]MCU4652017.1 hypothetical protein [Roseibacterium sp. SDUM158016]